MMKTLPLLFAIKFSPKGPESVKKIFPLLLDKAIEFGPSKGTPSYSLTSSASEPSSELIAITDCLSKSAA
jgi:hypothetical protein